jgi:hypothetical protein
MSNGWGGKREGAGRKPGPGKWSKNARELRDRLLETGKTPVELLAGNMLSAQAEADKLDTLRASIDLTALNPEDAKSYLDLLGKANALKDAANQCAKDVAPYLQPKVTQKDEALEIELPKMATLADLVPALDRIMEAVSTGEISTDQGAKLSGIIETKRKAIETVEFERRLSELEAKRGIGQ